MSAGFWRGSQVVCGILIALTAAGSSHAQQFVDRTAMLFPVPNPTEWTNQVTIGDLNGDNKLDLVFANGGNFSSPGPNLKARTFISTGGVFTDETDARTGGFAGLFRGVELGDCDLDGDLDIVLAQDFNRLPALLINNGTGFFTSEGATRLPALTLSSSRGQFGDVDNDGDLDLFFTNGGTTNRFGCGQYRLYLNNGSCVYSDATATNFPLGTLCENMDCIFGDIDSDFDLDIMATSRAANNTRLYRNDGTGVFTGTPVPPDDTCYSYDFGDIDGDGDLDLLGANGLVGNSGEILLENDGTGGYTNVSSQISPNPNEDDNDSKFFDYDNDGDLDLIVAKLGAGGEKIYNNDGNGNMTLTTGLITTVTDSSLDVKVADLNGDRRLDIVTAQGESGDFQDRIYINTGPADTFPPTIVSTEQLADTPDTAGPYVVRALIVDQMTSDRNFFASSILLRYSVDAGPDQTVPMRFSGGQVYRGAIPGQPAGSSIAYFVRATDRAANIATGPVLFFDVLDTSAGAGAVPDGASMPGVPLTLGRSGTGDIELTWSASCRPSDLDYEIYEGTLGSFTSHAPLVCSTGGATTWTLSPPVPDVYYLIVPRNGSLEGSYGLATSGPRPPSTSACVSQDTEPCP